MKAMGEGIVDGITTTINDKLINGTAQSRGEVAGDCAMIVADFVIGSKLLKKAPAKAALPDGDDAARVIKAADKADDILKNKTDDELEHVDDLSEVKNKGAGVVDDVVEGGTGTVNGLDTTVNAGKQGKHIVGNNNFIEGRSVFNGTHIVPAQPIQ